MLARVSSRLNTKEDKPLLESILHPHTPPPDNALLDLVVDSYSYAYAMIPYNGPGYGDDRSIHSAEFWANPLSASNDFPDFREDIPESPRRVQSIDVSAFLQPNDPSSFSSRGCRYRPSHQSRHFHQSRHSSCLEAPVQGAD